MKTIEELSFCTHCRAKLGARHETHCIHWGQVLPSECKGLIDAILIEVLAKREAERNKPTQKEKNTNNE